ncbi:hypothetical protein IAD21_06026 [Abditibacteriota bacterium]|nr:hypothetical protein IAD21_06026 [Abditibacteriota bacterium]
MKTDSANPIQTKAFSLTEDDIATVERIKAEEGVLSDSAALRILIRDGLKFRRLRQQAEQELVERALRNGVPLADDENITHPTY